MAHRGYGRNEYGTVFSKHICDACGVDFTVVPARNPEDCTKPGKDCCLVSDCPSYEAARDVDRYLDGGGQVVVAPARGKA